jgi:hypothetical protein
MAGLQADHGNGRELSRRIDRGVAAAPAFAGMGPEAAEPPFLCRFLLNAVETVLTAVGFVLGILTWRGTRRPG